jgi:hypothetical protein
MRATVSKRAVVEVKEMSLIANWEEGRLINFIKLRRKRWTTST